MKMMDGTYVDAALKCTEHGSHGLSNEGHGGEETRLSDKDVQQLLVNHNELGAVRTFLLECLAD